MNGILLINKPQGLTSHDVVYRVKRKLNLSKVGHTGTLDPFATGLLILLIGKATKLAFLFDNLDKVYDGTIIFGDEYDTNDNTGEILLSNKISISKEDLLKQMETFKPSYSQLPPMYSAIKVGGMKAYDAARQGKVLALKERQVDIFKFDLLSYEKEAKFIAHVSKGTYIRSLARDLGYKLNTYGALSQLNRLNIGQYSIEDSKSIDDISTSDLICDTSLFQNVREVKLNDYIIKLVRNGVYLDERQTKETTPFIVVDEQGNKVAYYERFENQFKPMYIF